MALKKHHALKANAEFGIPAGDEPAQIVMRNLAASMLELEERVARLEANTDRNTKWIARIFGVIFRK